VTAIGFWADNNFGDTRAGSLAGPAGLVVILLLAIGTIFLIRSMNARLRKLPERFAQGTSGRPGAAATLADESERVDDTPA
jgi:hypothetical protein